MNQHKVVLLRSSPNSCKSLQKIGLLTAIFPEILPKAKAKAKPRSWARFDAGD